MLEPVEREYPPYQAAEVVCMQARRMSMPHEIWQEI
jgi:hypothetical protein